MAICAPAGGAGAAGGTLALALETPTFPLSVNAEDGVRRPRELILSQGTQASGLASDLKPGQLDPALHHGAARLSARQFEAGGFGNLSLLVNGILSFDGDVALAASQSLRFYAGSYSVTDRAAAGTACPRHTCAWPARRVCGRRRYADGDVARRRVRAARRGQLHGRRGPDRYPRPGRLRRARRGAVAGRRAGDSGSARLRPGQPQQPWRRAPAGRTGRPWSFRRRHHRAGHKRRPAHHQRAALSGHRRQRDHLGRL